MGNPTILNIAGIDLGTTNTVISAFIGNSFLPITFEGGQYLCPSVVSLGKDLKVGDAAKVNMIRDCYCVRNVKRLIFWLNARCALFLFLNESAFIGLLFDRCAKLAMSKYTKYG